MYEVVPGNWVYNKLKRILSLNEAKKTDHAIVLARLFNEETGQKIMQVNK